MHIRSLILSVILDGNIFVLTGTHQPVNKLSLHGGQYFTHSFHHQKPQQKQTWGKMAFFCTGASTWNNICMIVPK